MPLGSRFWVHARRRCAGGWRAVLRWGILPALADYQTFCITRFAQTDAKRLKRRRQNPPSLAMPAGPLHTFSWLTFQVGKDRCKLQVVPKRRRFLLEKRRNTEDIAHQLQCKLRFTKKNTSRRDKLILQRFDRPAARKGGSAFPGLARIGGFLPRSPLPGGVPSRPPLLKSNHTPHGYPQCSHSYIHWSVCSKPDPPHPLHPQSGEARSFC